MLKEQSIMDCSKQYEPDDWISLVGRGIKNSKILKGHQYELISAFFHPEILQFF